MKHNGSEFYSFCPALPTHSPPLSIVPPPLPLPPPSSPHWVREVYSHGIPAIYKVPRSRSVLRGVMESSQTAQMNSATDTCVGHLALYSVSSLDMCRGFKSHLRQLTFSLKNECLGQVGGDLEVIVCDVYM